MKMAADLIYRLERISADSYWAHRASGCRVAILRLLDRLDSEKAGIDTSKAGMMDSLLEEGYRILENAAKELRGG